MYLNGGYNIMKKNIAVLFGGKSSEHDVSCISAASMASSIDTSTYNIYLIGITKEGKWIKVDNIDDISNGNWRNGNVTAIISPDSSTHGILFIEDGNVTSQYIDVALPALHGLYGEDGTVQGLFELAGIPYVGCGVVSSGITMDKFFTKIVVDDLDIRQAKYVPVLKRDLANMDNVIASIESALDYPVFVKPSNAGSSQGVSKAHNREELINAINLAAEHDYKILVEENICGRELECAVLGGNEVKASGIGEILAAADFYDYDAKYNNAESKTVIDPELPEGIAEKIQDCALKIFKAVDGFGLSRVDFFLENETNEIVFNEINTIPGFTPISMYPMLWANKGIDKASLMNELIELAYTRRS